LEAGAICNRRYGIVMIDSAGKNLKIGDYVRFMHNRNAEGERTDIGEIVSMTDGFAKVKYQNPFGKDMNCFRSKSGLSRLSDGEAMLYVFEKTTQ
jgi:hypothetical protein